jgi:hypothetical protein
LYTKQYKEYQLNFRTVPRLPNESFRKILEFQNVTRVALIYGPDTAVNSGPATQESSYNIKNIILSSRIQLLASIAVPYRLNSEIDKRSVFELIKNVDARYVGMIASNKLFLLFKKDIF